MKNSSNTINHFLKENNPDKLSEFIGLFNPNENEIQTLYSEIIEKLKNSKRFLNNGLIQDINGFTLNETLNSILKKTGSTIFVLHKFNNNIKMLYKGYDSGKDCSAEFHFYNNKLFLASFSYPKLLNGKRNKFIADLLDTNNKIANSNGLRYLNDSLQNIVLIEDEPVMKILCFNKDTLISLHQ